jgi:hypothetical protein
LTERFTPSQEEVLLILEWLSRLGHVLFGNNRSVGLTTLVFSDARHFHVNGYNVNTVTTHLQCAVHLKYLGHVCPVILHATENGLRSSVYDLQGAASEFRRCFRLNEQ